MACFWIILWASIVELEAGKFVAMNLGWLRIEFDSWEEIVCDLERLFCCKNWEVVCAEFEAKMSQIIKSYN